MAGEEDPGAALEVTGAPQRDAAKPPPQAPTAVGKPPLAPGVPSPGQAGGTPLPHERDEAVRREPPRTDPLIEQARRDLESGQVDTDLRATPGLDAQQRERLLRRGR